MAASSSILRHLLAAALFLQILTLLSICVGQGVNSEIFWTTYHHCYDDPSFRCDDWAGGDSPWQPSWGYWTGVRFTYDSTVGYRLMHDHSNVIILKSAPIPENGTVISAIFTGNQSNAPDMHHHVDFEVYFTHSVDTNATSGDIRTNTTGFKSVDTTVTWSALNGCNDTRTITVNSLDGNGTVSNFTAVNYVEGGFSEFPAFLNITVAESPDDLLAVAYYDNGLVTYKVGEGPVQPYPWGVLTTEIWWCVPWS